MKSVEELRELLTCRHLEDVWVVGYCDKTEGGMWQFHPWYRSIYVQCGFLLRCATIRDEGRVILEKVSALSLDVEVEEGEEPAHASLRYGVLADPDAANEITSVHLWDPRETALGVDCAAVRFTVKNGQTVFLDPFNIFGIRIGGAEQEQLWRENASSDIGEPVVLRLWETR